MWNDIWNLCGMNAERKTRNAIANQKRVGEHAVNHSKVMESKMARKKSLPHIQGKKKRRKRVMV